ncbi:hypothetical protein Goari_014815 [Gossypium aridum]|uniref:Uncharacterized protein n=1 Tax=Gossypium aridum TaxID=34290 RepID=A0A7J8XIX8_GOSAI|nr:hypothetical protein [Gossypium aridum]
MLVTDTDKSSQKLHIIDAVQRLGVAIISRKRWKMPCKLYIIVIAITFMMVMIFTLLPFDFVC